MTFKGKIGSWEIGPLEIDELIQNDASDDGLDLTALKDNKVIGQWRSFVFDHFSVTS